MKTCMLLFACLICLLSCERIGRTNHLQWEMKTVHDVYCRDGENQTACATVDIQYPVFSASSLAEILDKMIVNKLRMRTGDTSDSGDVHAIADNFIAGYQRFLQEMPDYSMSWDLQQSISVIRDTLDILSFIHESYIYTGGAHGISGTLFYNVSKTSGHLLTITDIIRPGEEAKLTAVAEQLFRRERNIPDHQSLTQAGYWFDNDIFYLPENFSIRNDGLFFLYNPYEIASYADGQVELFVPYSQIVSLLKENVQ